MGSDHPSICPYGTIFATADGQLLVLAVGADSQVRLSHDATPGGALSMVCLRVSAVSEALHRA
jgi:crotonobetainyl-CoA:carnitine CoA-transferase CaiB-like acyl-CoA transferase